MKEVEEIVKKEVKKVLSSFSVVEIVTLDQFLKVHPTGQVVTLGDTDTPVPLGTIYYKDIEEAFDLFTRSGLLRIIDINGVKGTKDLWKAQKCLPLP